MTYNIKNVRAQLLTLATVLVLGACGGADFNDGTEKEPSTNNQTTSGGDNSSSTDSGSQSGSGSESGSSTAGNSNQNSAGQGEFLLRKELPHLATSGNTMIVKKETSSYGVNYILEWDCDKRGQRWTAWEWTAANSVQTWNRSSWKGTTWQGKTWTGDPFQADPDIPSQYRSELSDYTSSGYNRGHICASQDRICDMDVNGQTFYLSNMHPQIYEFNAGVWENMESQARKWNTNSLRDTLWVCKGGTIGNVYLDGKTQTGTLGKLKSRLPIPKYFFMAFVSRKGDNYKGIAFWAEHEENDDSALAKYVISIDELEKRTGIDFFCNLPDNIEESVENMNSPVSWGVNN